MSKDRFPPVPSLPQDSDEVLTSSESAFLAVGRVHRPHGIRGEIRVEIHTDYPERFSLYKTLYLGPKHAPFALQAHRFHQGKVLLKLEGVDDRDAAGALRDQWVCIATKDAVPLEEGDVYQHQMLSLRVRTDDGEDLGEIADIIETGANLVYVIRGEGGELLLPDIPEVVLHVDLSSRQVTVHMIEGLR